MAHLDSKQIQLRYPWVEHDGMCSTRQVHGRQIPGLEGCLGRVEPQGRPELPLECRIPYACLLLERLPSLQLQETAVRPASKHMGLVGPCTEHAAGDRSSST